ncbi:MAG: hypothetical protein ACRCTE_10785, partial [Cellulosilyticaceae bacterium]
MKKISRLLLVSALGLSMLLTGCSNNKTNPQMDALQGQISQLQKENEKLLTQIGELQKQIEVLNQKEEEHTGGESTKTSIEYPVYAANIDTMEKEEIGAVQIDQTADLLTKLNALAQTLSIANFEGLPITVQEIKDIDGKKVAIINLKEDASKEVGWM